MTARDNISANCTSGTGGQILTQDNILTIIDAEVAHLQSTLHLNPDQCLILLLKFNWDPRLIWKAFHRRLNTDLFIPRNDNLTVRTSPDVDEECNICCSPDQLLGLSCGHLACRGCWGEYLFGKIGDKRCLIECMDPGCDLVLGSGSIEEFDEVIHHHYRTIVVDDYVKKTTTITKCPETHCPFYLKSGSTDSKLATCRCGTQFCSSCGSDQHSPVTCRQWQLWQKKCEFPPDAKEQETQQWILMYTKDCPKCLRTLDKVEGCKHVYCPSKECRYEFCWECGASWKSHGMLSNACDSTKLNNERARVVARVDQHRFAECYRVYKAYEECVHNLKHAPKSQNSILEKLQAACLEACQFQTNLMMFVYFMDPPKDFWQEQENFTKILNEMSNSLDQLVLNKKSNALEQKIQDEHQSMEISWKKLLELCGQAKKHDELNGLELESDLDHWVVWRYVSAQFVLYIVLLSLSVLFIPYIVGVLNGLLSWI